MFYKIYQELFYLLFIQIIDQDIMYYRDIDKNYTHKVYFNHRKNFIYPVINTCISSYKFLVTLRLKNVKNTKCRKTRQLCIDMYLPLAITQ